MAAKRVGKYKGCQITVKPNFWLRRIPFLGSFYFQHCNPTFTLCVECDDPAQLGDGKLPIQLLLPGETAERNWTFDISRLKQGGKCSWPLDDLMFPKAGDVQIRISQENRQFQSLFAFVMRPEEAIAIVIGVIFITLVSALLGNVCQPENTFAPSFNPVIQPIVNLSPNPLFPSP